MTASARVGARFKSNMGFPDTSVPVPLKSPRSCSVCAASCGMMHRAIDEGQRLLELCENDNLGVRYQLMHLYAYMEDEMHALALHKQFDSYEETQMLLPLAVLYYKLNQFDKAEDYIKRLSAANKDAKKFLRAQTTAKKKAAGKAGSNKKL